MGWRDSYYAGSSDYPYSGSVEGFAAAQDEFEEWALEPEEWEKKIRERYDDADFTEALIARLSSKPEEEALLEALSAGHSLAEACRLAGMRYGQGRYFIRRLGEIVREHT